MKAKHVLLAGSSGGGKTTKGREMHAKHDGISVWVNYPRGDTRDRTSGLDGRRHRYGKVKMCASLAEMQAAVTSCASLREVRNLRINYRCSDGWDGLSDARRFGKAVADHFDREVCTQIIVDEAHNIMPDSADGSVKNGNPLATGLHEDRSDNIKFVLMEQDPAELYYAPLKQCKHIIWCGEVKTFHKGFLEYYNLIDLNLPKEDYEYVVIKPTLPPEIVYRGETEARFG